MKKLFEGRMNRLPFLYLQFILALVFGMVTLLVIVSPIDLTYLFIVVALVFTFFNASITVRRFHDINMSGFWTFLYLVPFVGAVLSIMLLFVKGDAWTNKYGPAVYKLTLYDSLMNSNEE
jgi:uncharacterized membrane protein YhaH (DUF805 family)